ncbi:hypothetical protein [Roseateles violae]|uniref:Uncharacterized protein n=1 Tax=Roseateles violae TaxID=3058042 RepID=A0ABT8DXP6_9BURK|nr:hypothetical protein [Pelomonas sp. PFR6]MDN3921511.1 hypothetical protein [Pelomonas sp. PFR6]
MGALLDSLTGGGYSGDPSNDGVGDSSGAYYVQSPVDTNSSAYQQLASLATGTLSRYIDYDLQSRMIGRMPQPMLGTTQNGIAGYGAVTRTQTGQQVATLNLSAILPLLMVAGVVYFLAKS